MAAFKSSMSACGAAKGPVLRPFAAAFVALGLAGCVVAGPDPDNRVDTSLLTAGIVPAAKAPRSGTSTPSDPAAAARSLSPYPADATSADAATDRSQLSARSFASSEAGSNAYAERPSSTPSALSPGSAEAASDARTVRNAVSTADLSGGDGRYEWSNPQTGSSGVISALSEEREGLRICRRFSTTRQSYDGVALYHGQACTNGEGEWALVEFVENGAASARTSSGNT